MNDADKSLAGRLIQALGRSYTVEGELGRGGMGVVYKARDERLKRQVAIKVLPPELAFREEIRIRFLREAETAARLSHPHIVPIHSVGEGPDGLVYFVMAYVDGESLAARLKRRERLPPEEARRIMMETAEARWPTADALRRALESRTAPAYRPRRPSTAMAGAPGGGLPRARDESRLGPPPARTSGGGRPERRRTSRPSPKTKDAKSLLTASGEPKMVAKFRDGFVSWASVCGGLTLIDMIQGGGLGWSLFVTVPWAAFGLLPQYMKLWQSGYSWRDVINRPAAADAHEALLGTGVRRNLPPPKADEFGKQVATVQLARTDREAILKIMERVPTSERKLLPDVVATVDALLKRAEDLARMLHGMSGDVDDGAVARIEMRIEAVKHHEEGTERERQLSLLERQHQALSDLLTRRRRVEEQIESCVLAMQNVRFDLLRLRSAGVAAVLSDLTNATQQARALSRDVDHAIAAAGEIRDVLSASPSPASVQHQNPLPDGGGGGGEGTRSIPP